MSLCSMGVNILQVTKVPVGYLVREQEDRSGI